MRGDLVNTIYGSISADFTKSPLGELCVPDAGVQTGPFGSQLHASDYVDYGTPIITVEHLGGNRIIHASLPRVNDKDKERLSKYTLQTGDIAFSRVGSVDRRAIVRPEEEGWLFSGRCLRVRPDKEKIDPGYLSWFFGFPGFQKYIRQIAVGATMPSLNTTILSNVPIYYPQSRKEQQAIACILGALDDKIDLNRRMNQTLEAMARAIFKSWFVDFDPVRAKMNSPSPDGRGVRGEGIRPAIHTNTPIPTDILDFARQMRRQATDAEALLWRLLRGRRIANAKFRRQHFFSPYILDFYCHELKLAVELDGGQHNLEADRRRDARRDAYLAEHGIRVLRFWNNDMLRETEAVLEAIYTAVVERVNAVPSPPAPLPGGEGSYPQHILDLFPDHLVDSELGEIPRGWRIKPVGEALKAVGGTTPSTKEPSFWEDGTYHWATPKDLSRLSSCILIDTERKITQRGLSQIGSGLLSAGTVLLSSRAPVGYLAISFVPISINQGFIAMVCDGPISNYYAYNWCQANMDEIKQRASGTTFPEISKVNFRPISVIIPTKAVMDKFTQNVDPLYRRIANNHFESLTLAAIRDALLPKLISGKLQVPDAGRIVGGASDET